MTYRVGAYVLDTREDRVAQVIGHRGSQVQVRTPGGGTEWEVPVSALRLAMSQEREAVRVLANSDGRAPRRRGCARCAELEAAWRAACAETGERTNTTGWALNRFRTHWRLDHAGAPGT
ncbi:hypothetical protein IPZ58_23240 [Streptomyces roseoverticillatus]|uniref:hypothetical protein n=1 Tax=Streptomyces roseoverticillatus TaxID=66429 RepID=UPI001F177011|nr:hypothetical protein [Streptomyces roseoverticillatus]MCF3104485.1 hypothetical protein [Streptomyces roseoverticillatus]